MRKSNKSEKNLQTSYHRTKKFNSTVKLPKLNMNLDLKLKNKKNTMPFPDNILNKK